MEKNNLVSAITQTVRRLVIWNKSVAFVRK